MGISFRTNTSNAGTTTATPTYPASTAAGDLFIIFCGWKLGTVTCSGPGGSWTTIGTGVTTGGGADGVDTGNVGYGAWYKVADGTEVAGSSVPLTFVGTPNVTVFNMICLTKASNESFDTSTIGYAKGEGSSSGTSFSGTLSSDPGFKAYQYLVNFFAHNSDAGATSSPTISIPGVTVGTVTNRINSGTTSGNDMRQYVNTAIIEGGESSGAATLGHSWGTSQTIEAGLMLVKVNANYTPLYENSAQVGFWGV